MLRFFGFIARILGLICALVPGLGFLALSVMLFPRWLELGPITGPFYSLVSFSTGAICLYLGLSILFGRDAAEEPPSANAMPNATPDATLASAVYSEPAVPELQAAPLPDLADIAPPAPVQPAPAQPAPVTQSIFSQPETPVVVPTPESRIRQMAATRPNWRVTAPQLAQLTNLNMGIADATARQMVSEGQAQMQTGPNGEIVYLFDLASQ